MSRVVLDCSALLALLFEEEGAVRVAEHLPNASVSTVNLAEVYSKAKDKNVTLDALIWMTSRLRLTVEPFDSNQAEVVGSLREATRAKGLSLGDRACLALGLMRGIPVLTTDRSWETLNLGVTVNLIR